MSLPAVLEAILVDFGHAHAHAYLATDILYICRILLHPKSSDTRRDSRDTQNTQASYPLMVLCCASEYMNNANMPNAYIYTAVWRV